MIFTDMKFAARKSPKIAATIAESLAYIQAKREHGIPDTMDGVEKRQSRYEELKKTFTRQLKTGAMK